MNIEYKTLPPTKTNLLKLEKIRLNAYNINTKDLSPKETFYYQKLKEKKYLIYTCYLNNKLVGGCYISNSNNSLYIEQLFISKNQQNSKYHLGKNLLKYILTQKKEIEKYFNQTFNYSTLDSLPKATTLYKSLGYKQKNNLMKKYLP